MDVSVVYVLCDVARKPAVKAGVFYYPTAEGPSPLWVAVQAESRGFESIFLPEHTHFPTHGQGLVDNNDGVLDNVYMRLFDPLVTLAAVAAVTTRIRLGTAVCLVAVRDPIVTAKAVSTIDQLSSGRVEFGAGLGWHRDEIENHGVDWETRDLRFEESLNAMRRLWADDPAQFLGDDVRIEESRQFPKPIQSPHPPLHIGGESRAAMKRAIRFGGWLPTHRGGHIAKRIEELDRLTEISSGERPTVSIIVPHEQFAPDEAVNWNVDRVIVRLPFADEPSIEKALDSLAKSLEPSWN